MPPNPRELDPQHRLMRAQGSDLKAFEMIFHTWDICILCGMKYDGVLGTIWCEMPVCVATCFVAVWIWHIKMWVDMWWFGMKCHDTVSNAKICHGFIMRCQDWTSKTMSNMIMQWYVVNYHEIMWNTMTCCNNERYGITWYSSWYIL